jgi:hypothetical protein
VAVANLPHAALDCTAHGVAAGGLVGVWPYADGKCSLPGKGAAFLARRKTPPLCGLAGLALHGCPLAEMFGLDSSSSSKHKMACMWCNSRPRPGLSVIQEGPESSRKTRRVTRHFSRRP